MEKKVEKKREIEGRQNRDEEKKDSIEEHL